MTRTPSHGPIAITGASGFLASRLMDGLAQRGTVIGLDHRAADITSESETLAALRTIQPAYVIHAAAVSDTNACERDPSGSQQVNVDGAFNVAKACAAVGAKLIHLSSDQVFNGNPEAGPYDESCAPLPNRVYGRQKLESERLVLAQAPEAVVLRLTWLFGFPERHKRTSSNLAWNVLRAALCNEPLTLPGHEFRGITYVHDLVERFGKILDLPGGIYHAGSENALSTHDSAALMLKALGLEHRTGDILVADMERFKDHPRDLRIHCGKLASLGVSFPPAEESLLRCVREYFDAQ